MPSVCKEISSDNLGYYYIICNYLLVIWSLTTTLYIHVFEVYYKINYSQEKRHYYLFLDLIYEPGDSSAKGLYQNTRNSMCSLQQQFSPCSCCLNHSSKIYLGNIISWYHQQLCYHQQQSSMKAVYLHFFLSTFPHDVANLETRATSFPFCSDLSHREKPTAHHHEHSHPTDYD